MLRPLALIAVRQEQRQATQSSPLGFAGADELIDDHLGPVCEIAELAFPDREGVGRGRCVAIFETEHSLFRQQRVDDAECIGPVGQVFQRRVLAVVDLVMQYRVPVEESTAAAVLPNQAAVKAFLDDRGIGHRLGESPIHINLGTRHPRTLAHDALHAPVQLDVRRNVGNRLAELLYRLGADRRIDIVVPARVAEARPVDRKLVTDQAQRRPRYRLAAIEAIAIVVLQLLDVARRDHTALDQGIRILLARGLMATDLAVHDGLRCRGLVGLVVTVPPVTHQVDDDVFLESLPVLQRQPGYEQGGLRVITVYVKDRRLDHLGDIGTVVGRARI